MFTQFFGNYLLNKGLVSPEHLAEALQQQKNTRLKLGVLAINAGLMTAEQVDKVHAEQQRVDKRIGDIMVEMGYLTRNQVEELFNTQPSGHLLLGQALVDNGYMTNSQFESALSAYKSENGITDADFYNADSKQAQKFISNFYKFGDENKNIKYFTGYLSLLFKNLIRFIGDDFTPLEADIIGNRIIMECIGQRISGGLSAITIIEADEFTSAEFASRFANEHIETNNDYAKDCISEFLNLHNGLFAINVSNEEGIELKLEPQSYYDKLTLDDIGGAYVIPVNFSFGMVNFIISM